MRARPLAPTPLYYALRATTAFAFSLIISYEFVLHTITVGLNPFQLIIVGVVLECMTIFFEVPTGIVADAWSRKLSIIIGIALVGIGFLIEGIWPTYSVVLLAQVIWGLGFTFVSGATVAWITDEIGETKARPVLLRAMQIAQLSTLLGIITATIIAAYSIQLPIIIGALIYIALALIVAVIMPENGFTPTQREGSILTRTIAPFSEGIALVKIRPNLIKVLILGAIIGIYAGSFDRLHTIHFDQNFIFPQLGLLTGVTWFGFLRAIVALGALGLTQLIRKHDPESNDAIIRVLTICYSGMIAATLLFALSGNFWLAASGYCLSQMLRDTTRPLLAIWINHNSTSEVRATVHSFYWQTNALGQVIGTPPIGYLATRFTIRAALTTATLLYTLTLPLLLKKKVINEE